MGLLHSPEVHGEEEKEKEEEEEGGEKSCHCFVLMLSLVYRLCI